jgi:hypothetical protein
VVVSAEALSEMMSSEVTTSASVMVASSVGAVVVVSAGAFSAVSSVTISRCVYYNTALAQDEHITSMSLSHGMTTQTIRHDRQGKVIHAPRDSTLSR